MCLLIGPFIVLLSISNVPVNDKGSLEACNPLFIIKSTIIDKVQMKAYRCSGMQPQIAEGVKRILIYPTKMNGDKVVKANRRVLKWLYGQATYMFEIIPRYHL